MIDFDIAAATRMNQQRDEAAKMKRRAITHKVGSTVASVALGALSVAAPYLAPAAAGAGAAAAGAGGAASAAGAGAASAAGAGGTAALGGLSGALVKGLAGSKIGTGLGKFGNWLNGLTKFFK